MEITFRVLVGVIILLVVLAVVIGLIIQWSTGANNMVEGITYFFDNLNEFFAGGFKFEPKMGG